MTSNSADTPKFAVLEAAWDEHAWEIAAIRREVFVQEQHVPEELEWDGIDAQCIHVLARDAEGRPIGTGRLVSGGRIGRMAVRGAWRDKGVGSALLALLTRIAQREGYARVVLHAQLGAVPFYARHGFIAEGEVFIEAGIAHRKMHRLLGP